MVDLANDPQSFMNSSGFEISVVAGRLHCFDSREILIERRGTGCVEER